MTLAFKYGMHSNEERMTKSHMKILSKRYKIHYRVLCECFRIQRKAFWKSDQLHLKHLGEAMLTNLFWGLLAYARKCQGMGELKYHLDRFKALDNFDMVTFVDKIYRYQRNFNERNT